MPGALPCGRWRGLVPAPRDLHCGFPTGAFHMRTLPPPAVHRIWRVICPKHRCARMPTSLQLQTHGSLLRHTTDGPKCWMWCPPNPPGGCFSPNDGRYEVQRVPCTLEEMTQHTQTLGPFKTPPGWQALNLSVSFPPASRAHRLHQGFPHTCLALLSRSD